MVGILFYLAFSQNIFPNVFSLRNVLVAYICYVLQLIWNFSRESLI